MLSEKVDRINSHVTQMSHLHSHSYMTLLLLTSLHTDVLHPFTPFMLKRALGPAVFVALSMCSTASDLTSSLAGTAGDVWSGDLDIRLACKANFGILAALCCLKSRISLETVLNLLLVYS